MPDKALVLFAVQWDATFIDFQHQTLKISQFHVNKPNFQLKIFSTKGRIQKIQFRLGLHWVSRNRPYNETKAVTKKTNILRPLPGNMHNKKNPKQLEEFTWLGQLEFCDN